MKKFKIVLLSIAAFAILGTTAYAASDSLVGKKVQSEAPVIVNDVNLGTAIIIEGVSYLPVRKITEALGADVSYQDKKVVVVDETKKLTAKIGSLTARIDELYGNIETSNFVIDRFGNIGENVTEDVAELYAEQLATVKADISKYQSQITELEAQRDEAIAELVTK